MMSAPIVALVASGVDVRRRGVFAFERDVANTRVPSTRGRLGGRFGEGGARLRSRGLRLGVPDVAT
jgi:hypothetical protein